MADEGKSRSARRRAAKKARDTAFEESGKPQEIQVKEADSAPKAKARAKPTPPAAEPTAQGKAKAAPKAAALAGELPAAQRARVAGGPHERLNKANDTYTGAKLRVLPDVEALLGACRSAGLDKTLDNRRRACAGEAVIVKDVDLSDHTVKCHVPSLDQDIWLAARALEQPPEAAPLDVRGAPASRPSSAARARTPRAAEADGAAAPARAPRAPARADGGGGRVGPERAAAPEPPAGRAERPSPVGPPTSRGSEERPALRGAGRGGGAAPSAARPSSGRGGRGKRGDSVPAPSQGRGTGAERAIDALLDQQRSNLQRILQELEKHGKKRDHWIWWVFPTEMPGQSEPGEPTYVTRDTFGRLFQDGELAERWRVVLEKLCSLLEDRGMAVIPPIDHGRIHHFLRLWKELAGVPEWMSRVLERLSQFRWPPGAR